MHAVVCRVAVCVGGDRAVRSDTRVQEDERKDKECAVHHSSVGLKKVIAQKIVVARTTLDDTT